MTLLIGLLACLVVTSLANRNGEPQKPNFVLIVADDLVSSNILFSSISSLHVCRLHLRCENHSSEG